jgi:AbrB family looped-hinge helix DNA binding protein
MPLRKKIQRLGGSVAIVIPKSIAEAVDLRPGENAVLSVEERGLVIRPEKGGAVDFMSDEEFGRVERRILQRYGETFRLLAEYDRKRR